MHRILPLNRDKVWFFGKRSWFMRVRSALLLDLIESTPRYQALHTLYRRIDNLPHVATSSRGCTLARMQNDQLCLNGKQRYLSVLVA